MTTTGEKTSEHGPEEEEDASSAHPVDRGWAWLILLASWLNMFFIVGMYKTFGIFFIEFQEKYNSSSSMTSLTISLLNLGYSLTTLFVSSVVLTSLSSRQCAMTGSVCVCLIYVISAFAPSIEVLVFCFGLSLGSAQALILPPTMTLLGQYFNKRRSLANCIAQTGASGGSLLYPILLRALLDNYSLFGTLLFVGAMNLHIVISGALLRPTGFYRKSKKGCSNQKTDCLVNRYNKDRVVKDKTKSAVPNGKHSLDWKDDNDLASVLSEINGKGAASLKVESVLSSEERNTLEKTDTESYNMSSKHITSLAANNEKLDADISISGFPSKGHNGVQEPLLSYSPIVARAILDRKCRKRNVSETSNSSRFDTIYAAMSNSSIGRHSNLGLYASTELTFSSALDLRIQDGSSLGSRSERDITEHDNEASCSLVKTLCSNLTNVLDCRVLRRPPFWFFLPTACLLCSSCSMMLVYLPPHARDKSLTDTEITSIMSLTGAVDILSLVLWGLIADCGVVERHQLVMISAVILGITANMISFFVSFASFIVLSVILGLTSRVYFSMYPVLLVDFLGLDYLRSAIGIAIMTQTIFNAIVIPLIGLIRDATGSYVIGFHVMGAMMIVGGLWVLTVPLAAKFERNRQTRKSENSENIS